MRFGNIDYCIIGYTIGIVYLQLQVNVLNRLWKVGVLEKAILDAEVDIVSRDLRGAVMCLLQIRRTEPCHWS